MKKTVILSLLIFSISLNLSARENPFRETQKYNEELRILELEEQSYIDEYIKIAEGKKEKSKNSIPKKKSYSKDEVDKLINKTKKQTQKETKKIIKEELKTKIIVEQPTQIVYVKPRPDAIETEEEIITKNKNILPFVDISYNDNKMIISTKYKLIRKFALKKEKKLVFDFKARKEFYTKRDFLNTKNFKNIAIGSHKKYKYFRVVLKVNYNTNTYNINYNNKLVTISSLN